MRIKTLTIVIVEDEGKPPAYTLVGNLTAQEAYATLFDYIQQEAREAGKREASAKLTGKKG